ncbi:hypothetical protein [Microbacterium sp. 10M-3C3]|jgi:hypothetical protein|uniref:hypothetical protein n=1 Tax=Microbacterium sp. 10M-3C3 TaxID=2483401 RepID=UPI000F636433|nr:hypothetical protein [Microbacterium sp. 10M-3C3]
MTDHSPPGLQPLLARFAPGWPTWIDVGPGWFPLLARLDAQLAEIAPGYVLHQVKSKFGSLDYYAYPSADGSAHLPAFDEAILAASWVSIETCEECGKPAKQYTIRLWTWTLCEEHAREKATAAGVDVSGDLRSR